MSARGERRSMADDQQANGQPTNAVEPRAIARSGDGSVAEAIPRDKDKRGSGGDEQVRTDEAQIQGIPGAPGANSVLGNERGLSKPPHDEDVQE